jgi:hypothetical protein
MMCRKKDEEKGHPTEHRARGTARGTRRHQAQRATGCYSTATQVLCACCCNTVHLCPSCATMNCTLRRCHTPSMFVYYVPYMCRLLCLARRSQLPAHASGLPYAWPRKALVGIRRLERSTRRGQGARNRHKGAALVAASYSQCRGSNGTHVRQTSLPMRSQRNARARKNQRDTGGQARQRAWIMALVSGWTGGCDRPWYGSGTELYRLVWLVIVRWPSLRCPGLRRAPPVEVRYRQRGDRLKCPGVMFQMRPVLLLLLLVDPFLRDAMAAWLASHGFFYFIFRSGCCSSG